MISTFTIRCATTKGDGWGDWHGALILAVYGLASFLSLFLVVGERFDVSDVDGLWWLCTKLLACSGA